MRPLRLLAALALVACALPGAASPLSCRLDSATRLPAQLTAAGRNPYTWLRGPVTVRVRGEAPDRPVAVRIVHRWTPVAGGLAWDMAFTLNGPRQGCTVTLDLPVLRPAFRVFTPGERGVVRLTARPTYRPAEYGHLGWGDGRSYVLPLVSVLDDRADRALTVAVPPDPPVPHLQVEWRDARTLRLTMAHRAMGGGKPAALRVLLLAHPADYRAAIGAYARLFPSWFEPGLPRGPYEGTFWYHHIQDHPAYDEMARQHVRYLWASFWFTYLGEYLPAEREWAPYTYARWWKLGQMMTDERIADFVRDMHAHGIGTYAYFNVTEYGGAGGRAGDAAEGERALRERFADALIKDEAGRAIPTWEGAMAMNARRRYSLWPVLREQVQRHIDRLPGLDGFVIDRLDWASTYDWGHDDGLTMMGARPVDNMAGAVGEAVHEVCRLSHTAGKRVFVNQFYRVEMLRDVDGYCHENDYVRGLGYLAPYRPASAWHMRRAYTGDLLAFEAQLKQRLQWAVFPQMIAHEFPISQQAPNPRAADLMELYAPLFEPLIGKRQVLAPHCVSVDGADDANLFVDGRGRYVVPLTSRARFLSRRTRAAEPVTVSVRVPDAAALRWAHAVSADGPPCRVPVSHRRGVAVVTVPALGTAAVLVVGKGAEPPLPSADWERLARFRDRLFALPARASAAQAQPAPAPPGEATFALRVQGRHVGESGPVSVVVDGRQAGTLEGESGTVSLGRLAPLRTAPRVELVVPDEDVWFVPERIELRERRPDGSWWTVARWTPDRPARGRLRLAWCAPVRVAEERAAFVGRQAGGGRWRGRLGALAAWIPAVSSASSEQGGCRLSVEDAAECVWARDDADPRVPEPPAGVGGKPAATCWFANDGFRLTVAPPGPGPYRLTLYLLDYDRNGRAMRVAVDGKPADVSVRETAEGVYLTWSVVGEATVVARKTAGYNAVVSAVFVDPPAGPSSLPRGP